MSEALSNDTRVCVDIGASNVRVALADGDRIAQLMECGISELVAECGDIVLAVGRLIEEVLAFRPDSWLGALPPIGVGVPAIVLEGGSLHSGLGTGIPGGSALRDQLSERFATPVVVDNDASMAALGESIYGAGKGEGTLALFTLGTNIGMGVVVDGHIYRGAHGAAGEIGTVPLRLDRSDRVRWGLVSTARQDHPQSLYPPGDHVWLEELYGGRALSNAWWALNTKNATTSSPKDVRVLQLAAAGDALAQRIVIEAIDGWALAIATTCGILDPGIVLIGGGIVEDIGPYVQGLRRAVDVLLPGRPPRVEVAGLAGLAGLIGAAAAARHGAYPPGLPTFDGSTVRRGDSGDSSVPRERG